jgi:hypothetical protein
MMMVLTLEIALSTDSYCFLFEGMISIKRKGSKFFICFFSRQFANFTRKKNETTKMLQFRHSLLLKDI